MKFAQYISHLFNVCLTHIFDQNGIPILNSIILYIIWLFNNLKYGFSFMKSVAYLF